MSKRPHGEGSLDFIEDKKLWRARITLPNGKRKTKYAKTHDWSHFEAGHSDMMIACMGLSRLIEGEEGDAILSAESGNRCALELPDVQVEHI